MSVDAGRKVAIAEARKLQRMFQSFQSVIDGLGELDTLEDELQRLRNEIARHTKDRDDAKAIAEKVVADTAEAADRLHAAQKEAAGIIVQAKEEATRLVEKARQQSVDITAKREKQEAEVVATFEDQKAGMRLQIEQLEAERNAAEKSTEKVNKALGRIRKTLNEGAS